MIRRRMQKSKQESLKEVEEMKEKVELRGEYRKISREYNLMY